MEIPNELEFEIPTSFPKLNEKQNDIINEIINQTQKNTTSFNELLHPYEITLKKYNINSKTDDEIYSILLKLSLIPGSNWKEKWYKILNLNQIQSKKKTKVNHLPKSVHFNQIHIDDQEENQKKKSNLSHLLIDYNDVKARSFFRRINFNKFLKIWINSLIRWNSLKDQVLFARQLIDKNHFFNFWKFKSLNLNLLLRNSSSSYDNHILKIHLDRWRHFTIIHSNQKWLMALDQTSRKIQKIKHLNLGRQVLIVWTNYVKSTQFNQSLNSKLIFKVLNKWYTKFKYFEKLLKLSKKFNRHLNLNKTRFIFLNWYKITSSRINLNNFLQNRQFQLKIQSFINWRFICYQSSKSSRFYLKSQLYAFLRACKRNYSRQCVLNSLENRVIVYRNSILRSQVFRHWIICERGELLTAAHLSRFLKFHLQHWVQLNRRIHYDLEYLQERFNIQISLNIVQHQFNRWKSSLQSIKSNLNQASRVHHFFYIRCYFSIWKLKYQSQIETWQVKATSTRIQFLINRAFRLWRRRMHKKRVQLWSHRKKLGHLEYWLRKWLLKYRLNKRLSTLFQTFHLISKKLRYRTAYSIWQCKLYGRISDKAESVKIYDQKLKEKTWIVWKDDFAAIGGLIDCADSIQTDRLENYSTSLLIIWITRTRFLASLRLRFEGFSNLKRRSTIMITWEIWNEHSRCQKLSPIEHYLVGKRNQMCKIQIMTNWTSRSKLLGIIKDRNRDIKLKTFQIWNKLIKVSKIYLNLIQLRSQTIRKSFFKNWIFKFNHYKSLKIISRFKNDLIFNNRNIQRHKLSYYNNNRGNRHGYPLLMSDLTDSTSTSRSTSTSELEEED